MRMATSPFLEIPAQNWIASNDQAFAVFDGFTRLYFRRKQYRQYTTNLLKLVIYVRSLLGNEKVREYLQTNHGELVGIFEQILEHTEG